MTVNKYTSELTASARLLRELRQRVDPSMSCQKATVLLMVAAAGTNGTEQSTLVERAGMTVSNVSKAVADLSDVTSKKEPRPGLVESRIDPMNKTTRTVVLTAKGHLIVAEILRSVHEARGLA